MTRQSLDGRWELRHEALAVAGERGLALVGERTGGWMAAQVPGEVHLDLMAAGLMPEPLFSTNAPSCRWVEDRSWWYRLRFTADPAILAAQTRALVCEGLDYDAELFLNGQRLGGWRNALMPAEFEIDHHLRAGENELVVRLTVGTELAHDLRMGESTPDNLYGNRQSFKGIGSLRKPTFSYGWDWVDSLPNCGIWRGVALRGWSRVRIHDVRYRFEPRSDRGASLLVTVDTRNIHPSAEWSGAVQVRLRNPEGVEVAACVVDRRFPVGIDRADIRLEVPEARRWWPNGMGAQPLYHLAVEVEADGASRDAWERRIGLRTIVLDRSPLPSGHRFALRVNGVEVFCRGGNWVPADAIPARVDRARYRRLVGEAQAAGFTMLRVWGGGLYEDPAFYEACDEAGILVWQDFPFCCVSDYPDHEAWFRDQVRNEAASAVRRLRHHACLALWCGNNENTWSFAQWEPNWRYTWPDPRMRVGGRHIYGTVLPEVLQALDPDRPYWAGSPAGGALPDSEEEGDVHWWGQATMSKDMARRITHEVYDECRARFVSEYGVIGPCHLASMRQYLRPEEIDPAHHAFRIHTNVFEKDTLAAAISFHYADPHGLPIEDYIRYGQLFQAVLYGRSIEAMRFRKDDPADACAGALIWMFNDCWGETGWTPLDYYLRRKASWYWIRNACRPLRALVRRRGADLVTRLVNDSLEPREVLVHRGWLRADGGERELVSERVAIAANAMRELGRSPLERSDRPAEAWLYAAWIEDAAEPSTPCVWLRTPHRTLRRAPAHIRVERDGADLILTSAAYAHGVGFPDEGGALFSDNWFDLLPGVPHRITCLGDPPANPVFAGV